MLQHAYWPQLYCGIGDLYPFLQSVKRKYDPNNIFHIRCRCASEVVHSGKTTSYFRIAKRLGYKINFRKLHLAVNLPLDR
jgi:hypothetical protein